MTDPNEQYTIYYKEKISIFQDNLSTEHRASETYPQCLTPAMTNCHDLNEGKECTSCLFSAWLHLEAEQFLSRTTAALNVHIVHLQVYRSTLCRGEGYKSGVVAREKKSFY